jgi:hypothetical protein
MLLSAFYRIRNHASILAKFFGGKLFFLTAFHKFQVFSPEPFLVKLSYMGLHLFWLKLAAELLKGLYGFN